MRCAAQTFTCFIYECKDVSLYRMQCWIVQHKAYRQQHSQSFSKDFGKLYGRQGIQAGVQQGFIRLNTSAKERIARKLYGMSYDLFGSADVMTTLQRHTFAVVNSGSGFAHFYTRVFACK